MNTKHCDPITQIPRNRLPKSPPAAAMPVTYTTPVIRRGLGTAKWSLEEYYNTITDYDPLIQNHFQKRHEITNQTKRN